jgi:hypothetical protein
MRIIMAAASCSLSVASRRGKYMATSGCQRYCVHSQSIMPRAPRQRASRNIDVALEHNDGGKLALQSAFPVRAKTRRQTITPEGTPGLLYRSDLGRCQTTFFFLQRDFFLNFAKRQSHQFFKESIYRGKWASLG